METWVRFDHAGQVRFGKLVGDMIAIHQGDMFADATACGENVALADVRLLTPCRPGKFLGLWNNFHHRAEQEGLSRPTHPLYFVKTDNSYLAAGETILQPVGYEDAVVFEGELGVIIGKTCRNIDAAAAQDVIFGYTCVNDVTARCALKSDPSFVQWTRAKSFDTFGVFGPGIVTGIDPDTLTVRALVNGTQKQHYPVADMFMRPHEIVSLLSRDMTLYPGDLIACGTSVGTEAMPRGCEVHIAIDGIGVLQNRFE